MSSPKINITSTSAMETQLWGQRLAPLLKTGDVVTFVANLGAGKTTFIQGLMKGLNVKDDVLSPTFVLVQTLMGKKGKMRIPLHHMDFYRVSRDEIMGFGIEDYLSGQGEIEKGIILIEWADRFREIWPATRLEIEMRIKPRSQDRLIQLTGVGDRFKKIVSTLKKEI